MNRRWSRPVGWTVLGAVAGLALLGTSGWLVARASERPPVLALLGAIVVVRALGLLRAHARYSERLTSHEHALGELGERRRHWYHQIAGRMGTPGMPGSADLLTRFTSDVDELQHRFPRVILPGVAALSGASLAVIVTLFILPSAGLALGLGLMTAALAGPVLASVLVRRSIEKQGVARSNLAVNLDEAMADGQALAVRGAGHARELEIRESSALLCRVDRSQARASATGQMLTSLVTGIATIAVLLLGAGATVGGSLSVVLLGALVLLALGAGELMLPLPEAAMQRVAIDRAESRLNQLEELPEIFPQSGAVRKPLPDRGGLRASGLTHRPGGPSGPVVIDRVDFNLEPGERVALIGASGSGKSTLAGILAGLTEPDAGEVLFSGVSLREAELGQISQRIRYSGQDAHVFATSVRENVKIGNPGADDRDVRKAVRLAGLGEWLDELPDGLDTLVGEDGVVVSGGERQRLALSRSLVSSAGTLILDEPTAMLDSSSATGVLDQILDTTVSRSLIVITHDTSHLEGFDRVIELRDGHIETKDGQKS